MWNTASVMPSGAQVEARIVGDLEVHVDDIAQHREQVLVDTLDHLAVDEGVRRRAADIELDAALALDDLISKSL
jgi:hypothetical protein